MSSSTSLKRITVDDAFEVARYVREFLPFTLYRKRLVIQETLDMLAWLSGTLGEPFTTVDGDQRFSIALAARWETYESGRMIRFASKDDMILAKLTFANYTTDPLKAEPSRIRDREGDYEEGL